MTLSLAALHRLRGSFTLSLRAKLTALVCAAILAPLLALSTVYEQQLEADAVAAERRRLENHTDLLRLLVETDLAGLARAAGRYALDGDLRVALDQGAADLARRATDRRRAALGLAMLGVYRADHRALAVSAQDPTLNACLSAFEGARLIRCDSGTYLAFGAAVYDDGEQSPPLGWVMVVANANAVTLSAMTRGVALPYLWDETGPIAHRLPALPRVNPPAGFHHQVALGGESYLAVTQPAPMMGLTLNVTAFAPLAPLDEAAQRRLINVVGGGFAVTLMAGLAALVGVTRLLSPLAALRQHAHAVAEGDFLHRTPEGGDIEVRDVASAFNIMAGRLEGSYAALEARVMERTRDLAESLVHVNALLDVGAAMGSTLDLEQVLDVALHWSLALTNADAAALFELLPDSDAFVLRQAIGFDDDITRMLRRGHFRPSEHFLQRLAEERAALRVDDITEAPAFRNALRGPLDRCGFRSVALSAIRADNQLTGVLLVARRAVGGFTEAQANALSGLSLQAAAAIKNAKLYQSVEEARSELDQANQHKNMFMAKMSHELRTPLSAIIGYTDILTQDFSRNNPHEVLEMLRRVRSSASHLLSLINDVLDLSKIEAGKVDLNIGTIDAHEIILDVVESIEPLIGQNENKLVYQLDAENPIVCADPIRMRQALINLLSNALKFTQHGLITVRSERRTFMLKIDVIDTGVGISQEHLARLFQDFEQGDASIHARYGGAGLGLSLSRHLCQLMNGDITVESTPGQGSTFSIWLPLEEFCC